MSRQLLLLAALVSCTVEAQQGLCPAWAAPETAGLLDPARFPETSGIELADDGMRLFVINDGTRSEFFVAAADGSSPRTVSVTGFAPRDLEDLAYGRCGSGKCLFLGDIGDNAGRRDSVQIALIDDRSEFAAEVEASRVVVATYPDGPHDAEAIAVDAAGDLWLVTKSPAGRLEPAGLFRLTARQLAADGEQQFQSRGEIDLALLGNTALNRRRIVTSMDIAPDDSRFVLLSYEGAIEFAFPPGQGLPDRDGWEPGRTHQPIATAALIQAESISYADKGRTLVYTTESIRGSEVPLIRQHCR
jgi:hypothetical protein